MTYTASQKAHLIKINSLSDIESLFEKQLQRLSVKYMYFDCSDNSIELKYTQNFNELLHYSLGEKK